MVRILAASCLIALAAVPALAHHSFAVFFDADETVAIEGRVTAFRFTNPHGTIALDVNGTEWRVETTAPVVLMRRGWSRCSLAAGDRIRVEGWPARDGKRYVRLRSASRADGSAIGQPFTAGDD